MNNIDQILERFGSLVPAPQILPSLLQALGEEDADINQVVDLISFDPALTAKLLSLCNSTYFGFPTQVGSVSEAVQQLGFQSVYRMVAATAAGRLLAPSHSTEGNHQDDLWKHSVLTAFAAQFIAEDISAEPGTMFTAGLLHDLGRMVLMRTFQVEYARLMEEPGQTEAGFAARERSLFGMTHSEVGSALLTRWKFITPIISGVRFQNDPEEAGNDSARQFAACLHLSNALALSVVRAQKDQIVTQIEQPVSLSIVNRSPQDLTRYQYLITENMEFVEAMCRLN